MNNLPILSTIPRSGTKFLRYATSLLGHLDRGGRVDDRLTGDIGGLEGWVDGTTQSEAVALLQSMGIDTDLIEGPRRPPSRAFRGGDINAFATEVDASPA